MEDSCVTILEIAHEGKMNNASLHLIVIDNLYLRRISAKFVVFQIREESVVKRYNVARLGSISNKWVVVLDQKHLVQYLCLRENEKSDESALDLCTLGVTARKSHGLLARNCSCIRNNGGVTFHQRNFVHTT